MKKQVIIALLGLLSVSILPGCGKSKNNGPVGGVVAGPAPVGVPVPGIGFNGSTFTATGQLQMSNASGRVSGTLAASGAPSTGGSVYVRTNIAGDQATLYISGSAPTSTPGYTPVYATLVVTLHPNTVAAFSQICGQGPAYAEFYLNPLVAGSPGTMSESFRLVAANGCYGNI